MLSALQVNKKNLYLIDNSIEMYLSFTRVLDVQPYQPTFIRWLSLLYVYKEATLSVIRESVSISVRR